MTKFHEVLEQRRSISGLFPAAGGVKITASKFTPTTSALNEVFFRGCAAPGSISEQTIGDGKKVIWFTEEVIDLFSPPLIKDVPFGVRLINETVRRLFNCLCVEMLILVCRL